jgi:hypothetical protein
MSTIWVVLISVGATLLFLGVIGLVWYSTSQLKKASEITKNQTPTLSASPSASPSSKAPVEEPAQIAENFQKSIFDTFSGSSIDLTKAKSYLTQELQAKVDDTKESYWDLHNVYIVAGPCRISTEELDKTSTTATAQVSAEWGIGTCNITSMQPEFQYKMVNDNGQWKISQIVPLHPDTEGQENVPRGF